MKRKLRLAVFLVGLVILVGSCAHPLAALRWGCCTNSTAAIPPFAGMTGYAYARVGDYPSMYTNEVSISSDGTTYISSGNYPTNNTFVVSNIVSWTSDTITISNANGLATYKWTTDNWGIVIFLN
jgi:hypothetical protein